MTQFANAYRQAAGEIIAVLEPGFDSILSKHNPAYEGYDFEVYLQASVGRYERALELVADRLAPGGRILDVGGFLGAFPLALARLGHEVSISEKYSYYGKAMDGVRDLLSANGVAVHDLDMTLEPHPEEFDLVFAMAIAEHLANPEPLARHIGMATRSAAVIEAPSSVYWPKRIEGLTGQGFGPRIADLWDAANPFTGHHREYTRRDLRALCEMAGLRAEEIASYNYTPLAGRQFLLTRIARRLPGMREVWIARAVPSA